MNQLQNILSLYSEILLLIAAATLLGWFIGFMMQGSRAKRKIKAATTSWESRYKALEETSIADTDNLEEQLQTLAQETRSLQSTNQVLTDSLKKNDTSIQKARAESIELNRQHAETQERLQRIIQQKDREIVELGHRLNNGATTSKVANYSSIVATDNSEPTSTNNSFADQDNDINYADTIAISPSVVPAEPFDATVQLSVEDRGSNVEQALKRHDREESESILGDTAELNGLGLEDTEEPTVALDDEALAFAQRSYPSRRRGD